MQVEQERTPSSYQMWEPEFGTFLTDNRFTPTRPEFLGFLDALNRGITAVLVTDQPTTKFRSELQTRGYSMTEEQRGAFVILRVSSKQTSH